MKQNPTQDLIEELATLQQRYPRLFKSMVTTASRAIAPANPEGYSMTKWSDGDDQWRGKHVQRMSELLADNMLAILRLTLDKVEQ